MKRNAFIKSFVPLLAGIPSVSSLAKGTISINEPESNFQLPPFLKQGSVIGITSPAGYITSEELKPALKKLTEWGFQYRIGATIDKRDFTYGGTDAERLSDFQNMLNDPAIDAILCARGGYGAIRIIDQIDWSNFKKKPKWVIGFSDITVFHCHINSKFNIASIHSKMCNSFPDNWDTATQEQRDTIESIRDTLLGKKGSFVAPPNAANRYGNAKGILVGGNLRTIETLAGTDSDLITKHKILFIEDTGEYMYSIDRMLWNLKRSGKLDQLHGLIVGGFKVKKDDEGDEYGRTLQHVVMEKLVDCKFPVCFDFPVGHQRNNYALTCGAKYELTVEASGTRLRQM